MKTLKVFSILILLASAINANAEVFRWPQACLNGQLQIKNLKNSSTRLWLQKFKTSLSSETEMILKPMGQLTYNLKAASALERFTILNLDMIGSIEVEFSCNKKVYPAHTFEGGNLTYRKADLPQSELWLQNLYSGANSVLLEFQNRRFETLASARITLKSLAKLSYKVPAGITNWNYIRVSGQERFSAFNLNTAGSQGPLIVNPQIGKAATDTSYFLLAPRNGLGDSYIAQIKDPALVQRARDQIANPELEQILFAKVQKGSQGYNRNWSKSEKSFWSWSITEVTNFGDVGSTSCNGFPQAIEDRIDSWIKSPGRICFWGYRIKQELTAEQVATGQVIP
jgi:hypothetical protein